MISKKPALFGLNNSNRDFSSKDSWGKNQFNSSFPAALACYMHSKSINPVYLILDDKTDVKHTKISVNELFGINPLSPEIFFAFESDFTPFQHLVVGNIPRIDLVTQNLNSGNCLKLLEVKLTALPDNSTCDLTDDKFSSEIVIRQDTIIYLALSIIQTLKNTNQINDFIGNKFDKIKDWTEGFEVMPYIPKMIEFIDNLFLANLNKQQPLVLQPVWKTLGKSPKLADNCLDIFVWSDFALSRLFVNVGKTELTTENRITRQLRSIVWLTKMLLDFNKNQRINYRAIIDELSYNTKNDKAFSVTGSLTYPYLNSPELTKPRIHKSEIKNIILNGGHLLLSPERRFDAIIYNSPDLFQ